MNQPAFPFFSNELDLAEKYQLQLIKNNKTFRMWRFHRRIERVLKSEVPLIDTNTYFRPFELAIIRDSRIILPSVPNDKIEREWTLEIIVKRRKAENFWLLKKIETSELEES